MFFDDRELTSNSIIEDVRVPKQLFYGELQCSRHLRHEPNEHFQDVIKSKHMAHGIVIGVKEQRTVKSKWKKVINESCKAFEAWIIEHSSLKRAVRKRDLSTGTDTLQLKHVFWYLL